MPQRLTHGTVKSHIYWVNHLCLTYWRHFSTSLSSSFIDYIVRITSLTREATPRSNFITVLFLGNPRRMIRLDQVSASVKTENLTSRLLHRFPLSILIKTQFQQHSLSSQNFILTQIEANAIEATWPQFNSKFTQIYANRLRETEKIATPTASGSS